MKKIEKRELVELVLRIEHVVDMWRRHRKGILLLIVLVTVGASLGSRRQEGASGSALESAGENAGEVDTVLAEEAGDVAPPAAAPRETMTAEAANIAQVLAGLGHSRSLKALRQSGEVERKDMVFQVPGDFESIQKAIDAAVTGDVVRVAAGIYKENLIMKDGVSVIGEEAGTTILDGDKKGNVVTFKNISNSQTRLENLSIKNAQENLSGIFIENSSPFINRNILFANDYDIYIKGASSPLIQRNVLEQSKAGIQVFNLEKVEESNPLILDNLIYANKKGINVYRGKAVIEHNTISYNGDYSLEAGATFGIYLTNSEAVIRNNIITDNGSCEICSGIYIDDKSTEVRMSHNDLWNNRNNLTCYGGCFMDETNRAEDPLFENGLLFDFTLNAESPLLSAGSDGQKLGARL